MAKKKIICGMLAGIVLAATLSGCGDGSEEASIRADSAFGMPEAVHMEMQTVLAQPEQSAGEIKLLYNTGKLTEEEEATALEAMKSLHRNLEVEEYLGESIHMVSSEEWFEAMTPRLYEGCRSYTLTQGDETLLSVQVGYDISGEAYSNVCYQADEDSLSLLKQTGSKVSLMQTGLSDGQYDGEFVTWKIDTEQGEITKEQGTYSQGVFVGDCSVSVCHGVAGEAFELWTNRENMEYETKIITYNEQGEVIAEATPEPVATPTPETTKAPTATNKPAATQKPSTTNKPAAPQKPVQTPTPTQAPAPEPEQPQPPAQDNGGNSGGNDNNGSSSDNGNSGGGSDSSSGSGSSGGSSDGGGSSDSGSSGGGDTGGDSGSTGGDTDIDWSPDLM